MDKEENTTNYYDSNTQEHKPLNHNNSTVMQQDTVDPRGVKVQNASLQASQLLQQKSLRLTNWRWLALMFACFLMIGNYLNYDYPAYLQDNIQKDLNINDTNYNLLYTIYSVPNCILPLFGGLFIDKLGVRYGIAIFAGILILGQVVCFVSTLTSVTFGMMLAGRFIYGLGGENLCVAQSSIVSQWFMGKELSFALGVNVSVARLGSVIGSYMFPPLYNTENSLYLPLMIGMIFCVGSWVAGLMLNVMDAKADKQEGKVSGQQNSDDAVKLADLKNLGADYWIICASCVLNYVALFPFQQNAQKFLLLRFGIDKTTAAQYVSITFLMAAGATPFIGFIVDRIGRRTLLLIMASSILTCGHFVFEFMPDCPLGDCNQALVILPFVCLGIFYSFYSAVLWPCVALVCDPKVVGTAFGIITSIQNIGLAVGPLIVGAIVENTERKDGYFYMSIFFIIISCLCVLINIILFFYDRNNRDILSKPTRYIDKQDERESLISGGSRQSKRGSRAASMHAKRSFHG